MAHAKTVTTERVPLPPGSVVTAPQNTLIDLEQDLLRLNGLLTFLEAHGDDEACNVAGMLRPFTERLEQGLDAMRLGLAA